MDENTETRDAGANDYAEKARRGEVRHSAFGTHGRRLATTLSAAAALTMAAGHTLGAGSHFPPTRFPKASPRKSGNPEIDAWNERVAAEKAEKRRAKGKA